MVLSERSAIAGPPAPPSASQLRRLEVSRPVFYIVRPRYSALHDSIVSTSACLNTYRTDQAELILAPQLEPTSSHFDLIMTIMIADMLRLSALFASATIVLLTIREFLRYKRKGHLPPGPTPFPIIGNVLDIPRTSAGPTFSAMSKKYGASNATSGAVA